uniref:uncharacterized protein LOC113475646 n=1 Tax=Ciona intestinalis TaxID=7719 RepID=UPI000EF46EEF|nr:uncharacterized protein LOC113475646 [Ciona intestinalis]|eukprot:XP_026695864.1 uncharacterized protein LOC113475646 [Ciona intestinalis]
MSYTNKTYVESEGTYHYVSPTTVNYTTARSICKDDFQSQLAVLNTQQLFDKAKSLNGAGTFYIGLHRPNNAATYQWLDGSAFDPSLINGPSITNGNAPGCRGVVMQKLGQSNPVDLIAYECNSGQNVLCFTPAPITTGTQEATTSQSLGFTISYDTTTTTQEATITTKQEATTSEAFSTTSYDTTTTTQSPTANTVLTKVQPTTQLYNSTQTTTTGLTNTQSANAGGLQLGIVVGIPLGVVFFLVLLIAFIVWLKRRGGDKSNEADVSSNANKRQVRPTATYDVVSNDCNVGIDHRYETILPVDERGYIDLGDVTRNAGERDATRQIMNNTESEYCRMDPLRPAETNNPYLVPLPAP